MITFNRKRTNKILIVFTLMLIAVLPLHAQSEDELFNDEEIVTQVENADASNAINAFLVSDKVRIGGTFYGSVTLAEQINNPWENGFTLFTPDTHSMTTNLQSLLFFDARPEANRRYYLSLKVLWPYYTETKVLTDAQYIPAQPPLVPVADIKTQSTSIAMPQIKLFELFADFTYQDMLFFRFGKQTVTWGVGYFWRPADVINLEAIDPLNPEVQREGPVTVRVTFPVPGIHSSVVAYGIVTPNQTTFEETAGAASASLLVGNWEFTIGGYYQKDRPLRGMITAKGSIGSIELFGEGTLAHGSERTWITDISPTLASSGFIATREDTTSPFFKGTAGFLYQNSEYNISIIGQYLFDGEGYTNDERTALIQKAHDNESAIKNLLALSGADSDAVFSNLLKALIYNSGMHYAALSINFSKIVTNRIGFSLFTLANLSDWSGFIRTQLSWNPFSGFTMNGGAQFMFGNEDSEYIVLNDGPAVKIFLTLTLGSGSF